MFGRRARREADVTDVLDRARAHPVDSPQRFAALDELIHLDAKVVAEQALDLCRQDRPDHAVVGLQALRSLPARLVPRSLGSRIGQVTGALCGPDQRDAEVLAAAIPVHVEALGEQRDPADLLRTMFRHQDGRVRAAAASSAAGAHDPESVIGPLFSLLDDDPLPEVAAAAATGLAQIVCRDRSAAERFAALFVSHLDDPGQAVSAWRRVRAALLGIPDPSDGPTLSDDLRDELRRALTSLRGLDWSERETRALVLSLFIDAVNGAMRRYAPVPGWDEAGRRATVRELLQRAQALPAGSDEREELLVQLIPDASAPAWSDRHAVNVAVDEALTLCATADGTSLGTEALAILVTFGTPGRSQQIRAALADLRGRRPDDPAVLRAMLRTYTGLASRGLPDLAADRLDAFVLELLEHENAQVRGTAAMSMTGDPPDGAALGPIAERLIHLAGHDPEPDVRANAALGLAGLGEAGDDSAMITEALARLLGDPDPVVRAHALSWAVETGRPGALELLLDELAAADVRWEILFVIANLLDHVDTMPRRLHDGFTSALVRLDEGGWADRTGPGESPGTEDRAELLAGAAATLRLLAPAR